MLNHESSASVCRCVEAFEQSLAEGRPCALEAFLPEKSHPAYSEIVVELVRVEIELRSEQQGTTVAMYCQRFSSVFADPASLATIAFEDYRVRRQRGELVTRQEYTDKFGIDASNWPSIERTNSSVASGVGQNDQSRRRLVPSVIEVETSRLREYIAEAFPEFDPVEELGRGAFGRVFLARQKDLAGRFVVIKVTSDTTSEPERLARLQHTHIMPVYSVHRTQDWQAICMPFFGRCTLKDVPPDNIQATLKLMQSVAEGLDHAHRNGILHRDIKPANILVTDDGQPLLLDFNLSSDVAAHRLTRSIVGGTIPYLAPEQLESLQSGTAVTKTADIYSLGVILYERIAGQLPFESPDSVSLSSLIRSVQDRRKRDLPRLRDRCPGATAAVEDIVLKCLQPSPENRYQSAAELAVDLQCELRNLPLRHAGNSSLRERFAKWRRRHPRMLSVTSLITTLLLVLAAGGMGWAILDDRLKDLQARDQWQTWQKRLPVVRTLLSSPDSSSQVLDEGISAGEEVLSAYEIAGKKDWRTDSRFARIEKVQQLQLDEELSEIAYLMASAHHRRSRLAVDEQEKERLLERALFWNSLQDRFDSSHRSPHPWNLQKADISASAGLKFDNELLEIHSSKNDAGQISKLIDAISLLETGDARMAEQRLAHLVHLNPHDYSIWYLLGKARQRMSDHPGADAAFSTCIALNADCWVAWQDRAVTRISAGRFSDASYDCTQLLSRRPAMIEGYLNRAIAETSLGELDKAVRDLTEVIQRNGPTRAYFLRSRVRQQQGDISGAASDYQEGIDRVPDDCESWIVRGMAFLEHSPERALADFTKARELDPFSRDALQNTAHVLSERLNRSDEAVHCLNELLLLHPNDNAAQVGRAVLNARAGRDDEAVADAETVVLRSPDVVTKYQVACVYSLLSSRTESHRETALNHLSEVFNAQPGLYSMAEGDPDLNPIRNEASFVDLITACRVLANPPATRQDEPTPATEINISDRE